MMTPDPKYLAMKKASGCTRIFFDRAAMIGSKAPAVHNQLMTIEAYDELCKSRYTHPAWNPARSQRSTICEGLTCHYIHFQMHIGP